jgi:hypothetical protein
VTGYGLDDKPHFALSDALQGDETLLLLLSIIIIIIIHNIP